MCFSLKKKVSGDPALLGHGLKDFRESLKMRFFQKKKVSGDPALLGHRLMDWWENLKMRFLKERSLRRPCLCLVMD